MKITFKKGFTLVELMVVIAIIAILSSIMLVNFNAAKSKSRDGQRISDTAQIQLALAGYFNQCNQFPTPDTGSVIDASTLTQNTGCPSGVTFGSFIGKIPTPPAGGGQTSYSYVVAYASTDTGQTKPTDFVLQATLENNSSVSSESLTSFPSDTSYAKYPLKLTCDPTTHYCLGSK